MATAIERAAIGGTLLCLGLDERPLELTSAGLVRRQLTLKGSLTYDHPVDFETTIETISKGAISPGRIITDEHPFEEAQLAFERSESTRGKTWIRLAGET
jgi:alcohol dehydrogenase/L-iditol 2-dehydrogenase